MVCAKTTGGQGKGSPGDTSDGTRVYESLLYSFMGCRSPTEALSAETSLLRTILASLPVYIYVKDVQSRFILSNPAHLRVLGCSVLEEVMGKTDFDFFPRAEAAQYLRDEMELLKSGRTLLDREEPVTTAAGEHLWVLTTKVPLRDRQGEIYGLVGVTRDISLRKRAEEKVQATLVQLEESRRALEITMKELDQSNSELRSTQLQLIHAARLESLGVISAAVAHEVKNPLQTILIGIDYLQHNLVADQSECAAVLADMREAVTRARLILGELLHLAAVNESATICQDVNLVVGRALHLVHVEMMKAHVEVCTEFSPDHPMALLDKSKLEQALINLFTNALHAMPEGGILTVRTRLVRCSQETASKLAELAAFTPGQPLVEIEVEDSGDGISAKDFPRVFDPFFSTKPPNVGTGLGLPIVKKIMELHYGAVRLENVKPHGVRATLFLKGVSDEGGQEKNSGH